jgi:hypothetical protein
VGEALMNTFDAVLDLILYLAMVFSLLASLFTDDILQKIKKLCWAILFAVVLVGGRMHQLLT